MASSTHRFDKSFQMNPIRSFSKVLILIFVSELIVMIFLDLASFGGRWHIILDPILLTIMTTPLLYWFIVRPLHHSLAKRRQAEEEAEAASRSKSDFLANMSHEIRTPMTAILGYADLLMESDLSPSDRQNHLAVIRRNGEHLLALINDILDLSKVEAGKMVTEMRPCSVVSVVADVASIMRVRAEKRNTVLTVEYANQMPETILSDDARLRQALVNLVGNAIKFTENGSVRIVSTFLPNWQQNMPAVQIQVIDTGIGISPEKLPDLFDPFIQADNSTSRKYGGTGLGLAISQHIAELLDGELTVQSSLGTGSTFTLIIPTGSLEAVQMLASPAEAVQEQRATHARDRVNKDLHGLRILLAEDGIDNQNLISYLLRKAGAEIEVADNGKVAVEKAAAEHFDLILMDMQMPQMDGYQATSLLRKQGFTTPILALTAHAMTSDRQQCLDAGCNDYLAKPVNHTKLIQTIARYCDKESSTQSLSANSAQKPSTHPPQTIRSEFADDPDFLEMVDQFISALPEKIESMQQALANGDFETLGRLAHQLKGAGGSYGYSTLTEPAKALENAAKARDPEAAALDLSPLVDSCLAIIAGHSAETISPGGGDTMKILIIDDSPQALAVAKARLLKDDLEVVCAEGGKAGLKAAKSEKPDLILLDLDMPDISGFDLCQQLKADSDLRMIPVIFLTGSEDMGDRVKGLDIGAIDYVTKPFNAFELRARVRAALRTKHLQDLLMDRANLDPLTELPNRRAMDERLHLEWVRFQRHGNSLSFIMADIDHFKSVNDTHGHSVGDRILQQVAKAIAQQCRQTDFSARYGGEEFAIIVPHENAATAASLAQRCRQAIENISIAVGQDSVQTTASFGVADAQGLNSEQDLIDRADQALYQAKDAGRNRVALNSPAKPKAPRARCTAENP